jgi:hypothetical protein
MLTDMIVQASAIIGNFLNRNLLSQTYTEKYSGVGMSSMMLRNWPITAVASLSIDTVAVPPSSDGVYNSGFAFDANMLNLIGYQFTRGKNNVAVTYTAGYASLPEDVEQGCIDMVMANYKRLDREGLKSQALPQGGSVSYDTMLFPDYIKANLSNYKRQFPL